MPLQQFDDIAEKKILYYVYALRDPRDGTVFYVGKGKKNRWYDHINEAITNPDSAKLKLQRINDISRAGLEVEAFIVRHGIENEKVAYEVEAAVIHAYRLIQSAGLPNGIDLTNIAEVHHPERGLTSVQIAQTLYNAPPCPEITFPCGFFRLPVLWHPGLSDEELRQATLGWWSRKEVSNGRKVAQYAFAISKQIVRGIYKIEPTMWRERVKGDRDWEHDLDKEPRWGFPECESAPEMAHFLNTSVKHLYKHGDASAARFLNCK
jgi:hypothetical protein